MKLRVRAIILTLFLILPSTVSAVEREARGLALGTFHSFKGIGLSASIHNLHSFAVYADTEGIFNGQAVTPGFRISYLYHYSLGDIKANDGSVFHFYAGPGVTTGLVREKVAFGWMGGVAVGGGAQVLLREHFLISLEFEGDVAFFFTDDNNTGATRLKFYNKGIQNAFFPQLRIEYKF